MVVRTVDSHSAAAASSTRWRCLKSTMRNTKSAPSASTYSLGKVVATKLKLKWMTRFLLRFYLQQEQANKKEEKRKPIALESLTY